MAEARGEVKAKQLRVTFVQVYYDPSSQSFGFWITRRRGYIWKIYNVIYESKPCTGFMFSNNIICKKKYDTKLRFRVQSSELTPHCIFLVKSLKLAQKLR